MHDTEIVVIDFDGVRVRGPAHRVSEDVYRLAWTPWAAGFADIEVNLGDVVETVPAEHGYRRFTRVVKRSDHSHQGWVVGPAFLGSGFFAAFAAALEANGGTWEVPIGGWLLTHVPADSSFDVGTELGRQMDRACVAGVVASSISADAPTSQGDGHRRARNDGA